MTDADLIDAGVSRVHGQRRTQDQRSEATRTRLLRAAIEILVKRGYSGFRIAEVANTAGVSQGALIHHYGNKNSLIIACMTHIYEQSLRRSKERSEELNIDDVISEASEDAEEFFFSEGFLIGLDFIRSGSKNPELSKKILKISSSNRHPAEELWVDRLVKHGLPREQAKSVLWLLWAVIRGLAVRRTIGVDKDRETKTIELALELVRDFAARIRSS